MQNNGINITSKDLEARSKLCTTKKIFISCIVPTNNEQDGIANFIHALDQQLQQLSNCYEIIVVDDGSQDNTTKIVYDFCDNNVNIKLLELSRNFGKETALTAGLECCKGQVTILIDSDFQHPLELLPVFLEHWQQGYDMVYGICNNRSHETKIKRWLTKCFYKVMQWCTKVNIIANAGDFRLLDRQIVNSLNECQERGRFMKGLYAWVGFPSIGIPFAPPQRPKGVTSWHFKQLASLALTGITSFSNAPLRIWSLIGLIIAGISFTCALYIVLKTLIFGIDMPGYSSIMVAIVFFGGIQLLSIGILGEYIARIFNEVKRRPKYIVNRKTGF